MIDVEHLCTDNDGDAKSDTIHTICATLDIFILVLRSFAPSPCTDYIFTMIRFSASHVTVHFLRYLIHAVILCVCVCMWYVFTHHICYIIKWEWDENGRRQRKNGQSCEKHALLLWKFDLWVCFGGKNAADSKLFMHTDARQREEKKCSSAHNFHMK